MPKSAPKPKFVILGKSKFVHVVHNKATDLKTAANGGSGCQQVRKYTVAGKVNYKKTLSPEAALSLDDCESCATHSVAKAMESPESRKAKSEDARNEVLERAKGKPKKATKDVYRKHTKDELKPKSAKKSSNPTKTKAGVRSVGSDTNSKAEQLKAFGEENGWKVKIGDGGPGLLLIAVKGEQTIHCYFIDGKYDISRHAWVEVGAWHGALRGAHACRRQMSGEDPVHPSPGKGRSGPRKKADNDEPPEDESPQDAAARVPFLKDDDDIVILEAVKGKVIRWRNGESGTLQEAWLPSEVKGKNRDKMKIETHPKTERRMITFLEVNSVDEHGENYGQERTVYLDKITKVAG